MESTKNQLETSKMDKILGLIQEMRIEPFLFFFMVGYFVRDVTMQSVMMKKACSLNLEQPSNVCDNLDDHQLVKEEAERITLYYRVGVMLVSFIPAIISSTLLSPWSDKYGRKLPIMASTFGIIVEGVASTIVTGIPSAPLYLYLITNIPGGIFGGLIMAISSTYTYLSDITTEESRSTRYAFLECFFILSNPVALELGGQLYKYYGGVPVFIAAVIAYVICFFWAWFVLKETRGLNVKKNPKQMMKDLFTIQNIKDCFRTCSAERPGNIRAQIWLLILAMALYFFSAMGSSSIAFMYAKQLYNWSNPKYSTITALVRLLHGFGLVAVIPIFTKILRMPESIIGLVGVLSYLGESGMKITAYKEWIYICAYCVGALAGATGVAVRARLSKMVPQDDISKVFTVLALSESMTPLLGIVVFAPLYAATLDVFIGASYLLISLLLTVSAVIFIWIHKQGPLPSTSDINQGAYMMETFTNDTTKN